MATRIIRSRVCDPCQKEQDKETAAERTIPFGYGAGSYEIDVCDPCGKEIDETLGALAGLAQKVPGTARTHTARTASGPSRYRPRPEREQLGEIRRWAKQRYPGQVSDRGRIPERIMQEWKAEHAA
jgi:hypothetical protein